MKKHELTGLLLAALLTAAALMIFVRLPGVEDQTVSSSLVGEQNGVYDLTKTTDLGEKPVALIPGPTYYPNMLLTPESLDSVRPVGTDDLDKIRAEYLSQHFVIKLPDTADVYTLNFSVSGRHAMRVYVNGKLVGQAGKPGVTQQDTEVWENGITCYASPSGGKMDILLQLAQFYHYRNGAQLATLNLQRTDSLQTLTTTEEMKGFLAMGALLCVALLLLSVYVLRHSVRAMLYFALACLAMALRVCIQSRAWTAFPFIRGNQAFMLEYLSVVLLTVTLSLYLGQYAVTKIMKRIRFSAIAVSCVYGFCLLFCNPLFYTSVLKYYQAVLVCCIVIGVSAILWNLRHPNREQAAALYGIAVFYFAAISDILLYNNFFGYQHPKTPISEAAMLVFVLAQTVSLFLANNRRITEARESEQKLTMEKSALENLSRMKTEFLGNVSHELKTPLAVISGYAQAVRLLAESREAMDRADIVRKMRLVSSEAERLSLMVGQILDLTRMEEGRMTMEKIPCHVDEIIYAAVETHFPILNKNYDQLEIHIVGRLTPIRADPARISQVIVNLIANAVRFTVNGVITVTVEQRDSDLLMCVADTGAGISAELLPHLFERYHTANGGGSTGTGLGLAVCRHIVEEHGGRIWAESEAGSGAAFFFTLPLQECQ